MASTALAGAFVGAGVAYGLHRLGKGLAKVNEPLDGLRHIGRGNTDRLEAGMGEMKDLLAEARANNEQLKAALQRLEQQESSDEQSTSGMDTPGVDQGCKLHGGNPASKKEKR